MGEEVKGKGFIGLLSLILILAAILLGGYWYLTEQSKLPLPIKQIQQATKLTVAEENHININPSGFSPATIKIKKGTQITWTNTDNRAHRVSSDPHPYHTNLAGLDSPALLANQTFSFNFESIGTYTYHDHLNPLSFKGEIIVE